MNKKLAVVPVLERCHASCCCGDGPENPSTQVQYVLDVLGGGPSGHYRRLVEAGLFDALHGFSDAELESAIEEVTLSKKRFAKCSKKTRAILAIIAMANDLNARP